ncbi:MAG: Fis family transcriptional regulator, partial [Anaeromyxobacteraceae bacterium]
MPEIDDELIARALRWCADAGRHATAAAVREALTPLSWDELLAARALLADPPPARPLGPLALADLARGALPDVAAEREREGRYGLEGDALPPPPAAAAPAPPAPRARRGA